MKKLLQFSSLFLLLSGCCGIEEYIGGGDEGCADQIFTETRKVTIKAPFTINDSKPFGYANKITGSNVKKAMQIPQDATVKKASLSSAKLNYTAAPDNACRSLFVDVHVVTTDGSFSFLLIDQQNLFLPLLAGSTLINQQLNTKGVTELRRAIERYAANTFDTDLTFSITGEGLAKGSLAHFTLDIEMELSIVYEVCRYAPLGVGERVCE
ncbi:MAG: hypothetical protein JNL65_10465 [Saprospiraceae bacterium]|nr:hypothetical protein [Saprospiraceae bacterium]HRG68666.1 hypothetical protein [Saprospiraceae bacterium]